MDDYQKSLSVMRTVCSSLLNILFPSFCISCGKIGSDLCKRCAAKKLDLIYQQQCHVCLWPSYKFLTHTDCQQYTYLDGVVSAIRYTDLGKSLLQKYKYDFQTGLSTIFAEILRNKLLEHRALFEDAVFTYVPCHRKKLKWRGFNQVELIAKKLSTQVDINLQQLLVRNQETKSQFKLGRAERIANLAEAFTLASSDIQLAGKTIVIIDDVFTSGATLESCAKVLKSVGVKEVYGLAVIKD